MRLIAPEPKNKHIMPQEQPPVHWSDALLEPGLWLLLVIFGKHPAVSGVMLFFALLRDRGLWLRADVV